ncbi:alpha/beta hydrolase [Deinococcus malanensis]|uniref:Alpha/beta hydrolase n=1 Tax=Deinococcus malanensis TaxID=1706855 RepID=A0ABQ2F2J6_9DEIO|nr:alpha/beta hydrolase [Deinococcus malanensis]GGK42798.1 alpha/beta hydrolase [Deinococcus malanensis]
MTELQVPSGQAMLIGEFQGEGRPVVFLHAGVADRRMWDATIHDLSRTHRTVTYDRRGFGQTLPADGSYAPVSDLLALLDAASVRSATLVGCSQGGKIAIDFALAHPDRVDGLVLIAPAVGGAPAPDIFPEAVEAILEELEEVETSGDIDRLNHLEARIWLDGVLGPEGRVTGERRDLFLQMNGVALRVAPRGEEQPAPPAWPRLGELTQQTLIVCGDLDFPHAQERCARLRAHLPHAQLQVMRGTAHLPSFEDPAAFGTLLTAFLSQLNTNG